MRRYRSLTLIPVLFLALTRSVTAARADSTPLTVTYPPGWNMVGAVTGTDLSAAGTIYEFHAGSYVPPGQPPAATCHGYWALFDSSTSVQLQPTPDIYSPPGATQNCPLRAGWNLVGNPTSGTAGLPIGVAGSSWNPSTQSYSTVNAIPPGGAVWVYADGTSSIALQTAPPHTTFISPPLASTPYQIRTGEYVAFLEHANGLDAANAGNGLKLVGFAEGSNQGDPQPFQFWLWQAISSGQRQINIQSPCPEATGSCASHVRIKIDITVIPQG